jgi:homeobox protein cut-like
VAVLETQIVDLQNESSRLLRSLDSQKEETNKIKAVGSKSIEELERAKSLAQSQVESLKSRMLLYVDYDEIKRELDIMKVRCSLPLSGLSH